MQIEIVTIGNEVLSGRTLDTNFAYLARQLETVSVVVGWHSTVGDDAERIAEAVRRALDRADGVVLTGGLGPTPDDVTRAAVATALGRPLEQDAHVLAAIRERVSRFKRPMPALIETQAMIPRGAIVWPNPQGTAPALLMLERDKPVILLPGVPYEMETLAALHVIEYLKHRAGGAVLNFTLRTWGAAESALHEKIGEIPAGWPGATLAYLPSFHGVDLRVTVTGGERGDVDRVAERAHRELRAVVEPLIYAEGVEGMEEVLGELLLAQGMRIATAESCTGGLVAKRLTDVPGSSRYFERGFVTYANESKTDLLGVPEGLLKAHGAVSAEVAEQMAEGARRAAKVEVAVSITGIAGPDGGTDEKPVGLVFIGVASPSGGGVRKLHFVGTRNTIRERAAQAALDVVRRQLMGLPLEARL